MLSCFSRDTSRRSLNSASPCVGIACPGNGYSTASANNTSNIRTNVGTFQSGYTALRFKLQKPEGNLHNTQRYSYGLTGNTSPLPSARSVRNTAFCRQNSIQYERPHKEDRQCTYTWNIEACSCRSVTVEKQHVLHILSVSVALVMQHAKRCMSLIIFISVACLADHTFPHYLGWNVCIIIHLYLCSWTVCLMIVCFYLLFSNYSTYGY